MKLDKYVLIGGIIGGLCTAPANSFIFKDGLGNTVGYVDTSGNLCIETGDCSDQSATCNPTSDAFIIKDINDINVIYINNNGDLCLKGVLTQNGNP